MLKIMILMVSLLSVNSAMAGGKHDEAVRECLKHWGKTPFSKKNLNYRTISASVGVFGIGGNIEDTKKTSQPELIFLRPSVNVMGKSTIRLMNPNGWYCLKSKTNVMGKAVIELHCKAKMAISNTGATVLGSEKGEQKGTTVLGKTKIKREGC